MATSPTMAELGRRGGLRGGVARARALSSDRKAAIARQAARARWTKPALVFDRSPRNHGELLSFVAHYGSRAARVSTSQDLEHLVLRAVAASRRDPALARMLPVFLWRVRGNLDLRKLTREAKTRHTAPALGYLMEVTSKLGGWAGVEVALASLRRHAHPARPEYFFRGTAKRPFAAMAAEERTPVEARKWGLLTGTPFDSFETYFEKVRRL
jgi:hypothetical protein